MGRGFEPLGGHQATRAQNEDTHPFKCVSFFIFSDLGMCSWPLPTALLCDITSSHIARRTFIGNLYKKVKDPNIIASMSGHIEGSKAFARYRQIDDDIKQSVIDLI